MSTQDPVMSRTRLLQLVSEELTRSLADEEGGAMKLVGLGIQSIPPEAVELIKENVERLSLQKNRLSSLPQCFARLNHLRYLDLRDNEFKEFPSVLTEMSSLDILDLSMNYLSEIPAELGELKNIKVLSLKSNRFETIPRSILGFRDLRILEIENNPLRPNTESFLSSITSNSNTVEWLQEVKTFLIKTPSNPPTIEVPSYNEESTAPLTSVHSTFQFQDQPPASQNLRNLERSRSTSESYVSSRAAKRMGFIVKRPTQDTGIAEEDEPVPNSTTTTTTTSTTSTSTSTSVLDPRRNRSFSTGTITPSPDSEEHTSRAFARAQQYHDSSAPIIPPSFSSTHTRTNSRTESPATTDKLDSIPEHRSNDYFKRLSTLPETRTNLTQFKVVDASRKILFAFSEFQTTMKKLNTFCSDKQVIIEMVSQLYSSKMMIDHLVEDLEHTERANTEGVVLIDGILKSATQTVSSFKKMIDTLTMNVNSYTKSADVCFVRMLLLSLFMCYSEVYNAFMNLSNDGSMRKEPLTVNTAIPTTTNSSSTARTNQLPPLRIPEHSGITQQQLNEYSEVDEKLYDSIHTVLQSSNQVYAELNEAISKSVSAKSDDHQVPKSAIPKMRELTSTCGILMDLNKKIKTRLGPQNQMVKSLSVIEKKKFYDDVNALLKSIISILASTKGIMNESTILNEVRPSLASLTKATKDVTIMLEVSSYRLINDTYASSSSVPQSATTVNAPLLSAIPSVMSIPQLTTPLAFTTPMPTSTGTNNSNPFEASMGAHFSVEGD
ncbi:CYFA0S28e00716g1_1 [Cyberlindnera fabianii]|uniref:CYFA0S28e00716g1_1 n=1 Tax=Cyberlindnera fabianii TaxID=36022 RepID=A0A061BAW9_CYBFA|nr:CYFA0S28e00716g1_1 [Cyberlindnera fabianii]